ncbi:polyprenyl synthetase family protein, partial [Treponema sp. R6D11]
PTVHKKFGEPIALLAGDALQSLAYEACLESQVNPYIVLECIQTISVASTKMVKGQELDIFGENYNLDELAKMNLLKTGALITASVWVGGIVAGADVEQYEKLGTFSKNIGL